MRKIKNLLLICSVLFLTGCVKFNATMDIKKDKSMEYGIIYAVDTSMMGDGEIFTEEQKKQMKSEGFTLKDYEEDGYKGFKITKNIANIDKVSVDTDVEYSISNFAEDGNSIFKVKKGLLKNKYTAHFKFDPDDSSLNSDSSSPLKSGDEGILHPLEGESDDEFDFSKMDTDFDLSFVVKLPYSALSNNATNASNNNKELKWTLLSSNAQDIKFEFELYNNENTYIIIGGGAIFGIALLIIVINILGKKKNKESKVEIKEELNSSQTLDVKDEGFTAREFGAPIKADVHDDKLDVTVPVNPEPVISNTPNETLNDASEKSENEMTSFVPKEEDNIPVQEEEVVNAFSQPLVDESTKINDPNINNQNM